MTTAPSQNPMAPSAQAAPSRDVPITPVAIPIERSMLTQADRLDLIEAQLRRIEGMHHGIGQALSEIKYDLRKWLESQP